MKTHPNDARLHGTIYCIHFDEPFRHAKHYVGFTTILDERLIRHQVGRGSNLMRHVSAAGIPWRIAGLWKGTRADERRLKNGGAATRYCPCCLDVQPRRRRRPCKLEAVPFSDRPSYDQKEA